LRPGRHNFAKAVPIEAKWEAASLLSGRAKPPFSALERPNPNLI
jgi:hypothetical protein